MCWLYWTTLNATKLECQHKVALGGEKTQTSPGWVLLQENQTLFEGCSSRRFLRGSLRTNHHSSSAATGAARGLCGHRSWAHTCKKHDTFTEIATGLLITRVLGVFFKVVREKLHLDGPAGLFTELFKMRKSRTKRATSSITTAPGMFIKTKK